MQSNLLVLLLAPLLLWMFKQMRFQGKWPYRLQWFSTFLENRSKDAAYLGNGDRIGYGIEV
jgi:hypothetical protein